jgi:hypothetical protein
MTTMAVRAQQATTDPAKPWAIYARLSKKADGDLEKVEYQIEMCDKYAASRDLPVSKAHVYKDPSLSAWKKRASPAPLRAR